MRFYGFGNYYLSSLQQGLQAAHCVAEMFVKYGPNESNQLNQLYDWAENHKTMVLLNGGNSASLADLYNHLNDSDNPYPFVKFHEDEQSLNGALTYVGIILPERVYDAAAQIREGTYEFNSYQNPSIEPISFWEHGLITLLNDCGLAK